jgi:cobalt-zinc-cadmium resistance protein CzcA
MLFMSLKQEFVPTLNEGSWTAMVYQPANTSLKTSLEHAASRRRSISSNKVPEVTRTFARVGTSEVATDPDVSRRIRPLRLLQAA